MHWACHTPRNPRNPRNPRRAQPLWLAMMTSIVTRRVLIIEDDAGTRQLVADVLAEEGYETRGARDGRAALELLGQTPVDLVLLDLHLLGMDGAAFVQAYRRLPGPHAPIILCTGDGVVAAAIAAAQLQVAGFIAMPFDLAALLDTVGRHAGGQVRGQAGQAASSPENGRPTSPTAVRERPGAAQDAA